MRQFKEEHNNGFLQLKFEKKNWLAQEENDQWIVVKKYFEFYNKMT